MPCALERWDLAHAAYDEALRLSPELGDARIHANIGLALQHDGKLGQAFARFRKAVELTPDAAEMWQYLANAHVADEDWAAAISCCERIVALEPQKAQSHCDLGWALQEEGRIAEAAACYRRALELEPDNVNGLLKQGGLHEELGAMAEAESCYRLAQAVEVNAPAPLACLATLLRRTLPEADQNALRLRLDDPRLDDGPRRQPAFWPGPRL